MNHGPKYKATNFKISRGKHERKSWWFYVLYINNLITIIIKGQTDNPIKMCSMHFLKTVYKWDNKYKKKCINLVVIEKC
jgi:hypothetical protein